MINLSDFLSSNGINFIDLYVSDIEGLDFNVLKSIKSFIDEKKIKKIQCEVVVNNLSNPYEDLENAESNFTELLSKNYVMVASGWGNLIEGSHEVIQNYRFKDVMWALKD